MIALATCRAAPRPRPRRPPPAQRPRRAPPRRRCGTTRPSTGTPSTSSCRANVGLHRPPRRVPGLGRARRRPAAQPARGRALEHRQALPAELDAAGLPVVPTAVVAPGDRCTRRRWSSSRRSARASIDAARHDDHEAAAAHVARLHARRAHGPRPALHHRGRRRRGRPR